MTVHFQCICSCNIVILSLILTWISGLGTYRFLDWTIEGASSSRNLRTTSAFEEIKELEDIEHLSSMLTKSLSSTPLVDTVSLPRSIRPGSLAWRLPPSGTVHRCLRWSRTRSFSQLCPAQTCTGSCCLARPQTPPPAPSSGYAAWRRSEKRR